MLERHRAPDARRAQLVDFLLSDAFQDDIPLNMFVYPVRTDAALPEVFTKFARRRRPPADAAARDRSPRTARQWIKAVDRRSCCGERATALGTRLAGVARRAALAAVPVAFLAVFFVVAASSRSSSAGWSAGALAATCSATAGLRPRRVVHAVAGGAVDGADAAVGAARRLRARALRVPRPRLLLAVRHRAVRAADRRRRRRVPRAARPASCARHRLTARRAILVAHVFFNFAVVVRTVGGLWAQLDPAPRGGGARARRLAAGGVPRGRRCRCCGPRSWPRRSIVFLFTFTSFGVVLLLGGPAHPTLEVEIYRADRAAARPADRRRARARAARRASSRCCVVRRARRRRQRGRPAARDAARDRTPAAHDARVGARRRGQRRASIGAAARRAARGAGRAVASTSAAATALDVYRALGRRRRRRHVARAAVDGVAQLAALRRRRRRDRPRSSAGCAAVRDRRTAGRRCTRRSTRC